jgi:glutamine synthetase
MLGMVKNEILPAVSEYTKKLGESVLAKMQIDPSVSSEYELSTLKKLSDLSTELYNIADELLICNEKINNMSLMSEIKKCACGCENSILPIMHKMRENINELEINMPKKYWPFPTYEDMLFSV